MNCDSHASEEVLERYSLGTLSDVEAEVVEEHLLICAECQERLREADAYVLAAKQAAAGLRDTRQPWSEAWRAVCRGLARPQTACAAAMGLALLLVATQAWDSGEARAEPAVLVQLEALRGGGVPGAQAPVGKPLLLRIDTAGLPLAENYRVEVVDARGAPVYVASCGSAGGDVPLRRRLRAGRYWVRVVQPTPDYSLLREFGLDLK